MAPIIKRIYSGKDSEMLIATGTIVEVCISDKAFLIGQRANWADPFFGDLKDRIEAAIANQLGFDNAQALRQATAALYAFTIPTEKSLTDFNIQLQEDYKSNKPRLRELQTNLGFAAHYKAMKQGDQEALVELLAKFKLNMTAALRSELTVNGMAATLITAIVDAATEVAGNNTLQEAAKAQRPVQSAAVVQAFNEIYSTLISVAKIARRFYDTKEKQDQFSYAKQLKRLNPDRGKKPAEG